MKSESSMVKVTVAILTKNPGHIFKEVLQAVLCQKAPWNYEIIIIDSGSSDGTIEYIEQYPEVRLIKISSNEFGHGKTRNYAMSLAAGEFVAMLTHDAKPVNDTWLVRLVTPLELDDQVAGAFGRHIAYSNASPYIKRDLVLHFNGFLEWPLVMGIEDPDRYKREQGYRQVLHFFSDNNACLRKKIWEEIPYPDVDFAEDQLWAKAIIEAGYKRAYVNEATVFHSHDYSVWNTFRRSFDESRALKRLFGYELSPSFAHGAYQVFACTRRDLIYLRRTFGIKKNISIAFNTPLQNLAKQSGFYIGSYQGLLKNLFFKMLSLDNSKKISK
jgi:rhamnosyltransferase